MFNNKSLPLDKAQQTTRFAKIETREGASCGRSFITHPATITIAFTSAVVLALLATYGALVLTNKISDFAHITTLLSDQKSLIVATFACGILSLGVATIAVIGATGCQSSQMQSGHSKNVTKKINQNVSTQDKRVMARLNSAPDWLATPLKAMPQLGENHKDFTDEAVQKAAQPISVFALPYVGVNLCAADLGLCLKLYAKHVSLDNTYKRRSKITVVEELNSSEKAFVLYALFKSQPGRLNGAMTWHLSCQGDTINNEHFVNHREACFSISDIIKPGDFVCDHDDLKIDSKKSAELLKIEREDLLPEGQSRLVWILLRFMNELSVEIKEQKEELEETDTVIGYWHLTLADS